MLDTIFFLIILLKGSRAFEPTTFSFNTRIVNGTDANEGEIPFQVSLQTTFGHFCGGSILNENYIVTASHCVQGQSPKQITVVVGTVDLKKPRLKYKASKIISHKEYDPFNSYINDIALIKLDKPLEFSALVQPVTLPKFQWKVRANSTAVVSGWGGLGGTSSQLPNILQKAQIWTTDQDYCKKMIEERYLTIHPTQICANDPTTRRGQCNGDSGGPLIVEGKLTGIVSWSIKDPFCASTRYPGVYTRVPEFVDWIKANAV